MISTAHGLAHAARHGGRIGVLAGRDLLFNEPSLFWGGGVSLALLLTGVSGAYRLLPEPAPLGSGLSHDMGVDAVASLVIVAALGVVLWPLR